MNYVRARSPKIKVKPIKNENICHALMPFMASLQRIGILPLYNIDDADKMRFVLKSWRTLFSVLWIIAFVVITGICIGVGFQVSYNIGYVGKYAEL